MLRQSASLGVLRFSVLSGSACALCYFLTRVLLSHAYIWQWHDTIIVLFATAIFVLGRQVIRKERQFRDAIKVREEFWELLNQHMPVLLCIADAEGRLLRWNTQLEVTLGYSAPELSQIRIVDVVAEEDRPGIQQSIEAAFTSASADTEASLLCKKGKKVQFHLAAKGIAFRSKRCVLVVGMDMSAQKRAQEHLRLQAVALRAAANEIVITTRDGVIQWVNPAFTDITGYTMDESIGQTPRIVRSGEHGQEFYANLWSTISSGKVWRGEVINRRKDGSLYNEEMTITPVADNDGRITHYIAIKHDVTIRKQAQEALRQAEERYRSIFEQAIIGIFQSTPEGDFVTMNPAMARMLGYDSPQQALTEIREIASLYPRGEKRRDLLADIKAGGELHNYEDEFCRRDGSELWLSLNLRCVYNQDGTASYYAGTAEDITQRKLLERQLRQAQKMEAVARLAGGVSHDFNNMLGIITGYSELLQSRTDFDNAAVQQIQQIHGAGKKAAALTQQLLAFSRKQITQPRVLDLNEVLRKISNMLRRLIGEDVELIMRFSSRDIRVNVDASQIDQVIMNLAVNARDAMPEGGKLIIETDVCELDMSYSMRRRPVLRGSYARIIITDTGCGIDQETMAHVFEPFFTTKELGKGTGLGLSIVYGIVKQSNGYIWVYSEVGQGTSFKIYLPLQSAEIDQADTPRDVKTVTGSERLLVVEDDHELRTMEAGFLKGLGYSVTEAENGERALEIALKIDPPPQVLITDIVMPKINGRDLADRLLAELPDLKVLYTSGYTHNGVVQTRPLNHGEAFLQKPFALAELSKKLREVLDTTLAADSSRATAKY